jgi:hypothetical protein
MRPSNRNRGHCPHRLQPGRMDSPALALLPLPTGGLLG